MNPTHILRIPGKWPHFYCIRTVQCVRKLFSTQVNEVMSTSGESDNIGDVYKNVMRKVPQPVVVVSTAEYDILKNRWSKRGITCTSFNSVSFNPPVVSICLKHPSRMHDLLLRTQHFAVHVLANDQVKYGVHFAEPVKEDTCQFTSVPHQISNDSGLPLISGCSAVLECTAKSVHTVGDHHVWYGDVYNGVLNDSTPDPLLYFIRSFRSVGDEIFIKAFEDATLPYEDWTHEAHLRMAWNYITELGKDGATPHIIAGIQHFNEQNKDKVKFGYHETITMFYISVVTDAIQRSDADQHFDSFISLHTYLLDRNLPSQYYSKDRLFCSEARHKFVTPDIRPLPC
ncbi:uncharacterized protein LOC110467376 isoform X1 [Mizuhopecten yessoensis]|uniref:uncharacterized protein LOC110467376 isoform X1 n=1 Tax=Mizuhopecten yessoensis TaxID=6573 RepID=UPI000B45927A|nr:uncharacterized protein LOC110467376 isoform X1 [Mizuhopecten yessoensis]XP_021380173.1 uncharacterized protein LOC110467376 isoform X1 [Mizuhopecten yessoensis]